jgi:type II restriction enzyme methylase subunits-like protein
MSTATLRAYRSRFAGRFYVLLKPESLEIKPFCGYQSTHSRKVHCIKDNVLLDSACGSGNFLTETYTCLRKLEDTVLNELRKGQDGLSFYLLHIKQMMLQLKKFMELTLMGMKKKIVAHLFKLYAEKAKKK